MEELGLVALNSNLSTWETEAGRVAENSGPAGAA